MYPRAAAILCDRLNVKSSLTIRSSNSSLTIFSVLAFALAIVTAVIEDNIMTNTMTVVNAKRIFVFKLLKFSTFLNLDKSNSLIFHLPLVMVLSSILFSNYSTPFRSISVPITDKTDSFFYFLYIFYYIGPFLENFSYTIGIFSTKFIRSVYWTTKK